MISIVSYGKGNCFPIISIINEIFFVNGLKEDVSMVKCYVKR